MLQGAVRVPGLEDCGGVVLRYVLVPYEQLQGQPRRRTARLPGVQDFGRRRPGGQS